MNKRLRKEIYETRLKLVHQLHKYIMDTGDEEIFEVWFRCGLPDNPCEEDFEFFAKDAKEFRSLCELFGHLTCNEKKY